MMMKILLLEANSIQSQPIAKSLRKEGCYVIGFCEEKLSYGYYSKYFNEKYLTCSCAHDENEYYDYITNYLGRNKIDVIIPMSDDSAVFLAKHQDILRQYTSFSIPEYNSFMKGYDKNQLMAVCKEIGVEHPLTIDLSGNYDLSGMKYPAIIKPNITTGGRGMKICMDEKELKDIIPTTLAHYGNSHVQEFIPSGGRQIKVQLLVDKDQKLLCHSVMWKQRMYPINGGSSCCNIIIEDYDLVKKCYSVLKHIGWRGFADFDVIEDPRDLSLKIMEINPRVPACIKSAISAGVNWGTAIVKEATDHEFDAFNIRRGVTLRYLGFDVLWFFKSKDRFGAKPSWFKFWGENIFYEDIDSSDILSFIMGTYGNIKKILNPNFRAEKSGTN